MESQLLHLILLAIVATAGIAWSYNSLNSPAGNSANFESFSFLGSLRTLVGAGEKTLIGEDDDRINFLLLGVGGTGHAGPELTDSIIFASFRPSSGEIGLLSIPRDLAVPIPGYGYRKINSINAYGELEEQGYGPEWTAKIVGELLGQTVHYYIKADFAGFVEMINEIGGIQVLVDRSFTDTSYPTDDDLITTINFVEGWQTMTGSEALQFARSRHGSNGEGSDFARAERQQKILLAVKEKLLSASTFLNPSKLNRLIDVFEQNVSTNLSFWEIMKLARSAANIDIQTIAMQVLNDGPDGLLYSTTVNDAYVLLPKRDDWAPIQALALNILTENSDTSSLTAVENTSEIAPELSATIEIQNGTGVSGLAFQTSQLLSASNFTVVAISNADSKTYQTTIIYDLTNGEKTRELSALREFLQADVAMSPAGWVFSDEIVPRELTVDIPENTGSDVDFLVILGENAVNFVFQ